MEQQQTHRVTAETKKCSVCNITKNANQFHINTARKNGLQSYCKKCTAERTRNLRAVTDILTNEEESLLLSYLPFAHMHTKFLCRNPNGATVEKAQPLTITDIARENGLSHSDTLRIMYKFVRLVLASLVIKADDDGVAVTNIVYKPDNIQEYIFNTE